MSIFATPAPITAALTTAGARVRITASERQDTMVSVEPLDRGNRTDVKVAERTEVDFADGHLSVRTRKSGSREGSVAITIDLPTGSHLTLHTAWSDVHAKGDLGDCELNVSSGRVELDRVSTVRADLAAGDLGIAHVTGNVSIEGGTAGVRLGETAGPVRYRGSTGTIHIGHALSDLDLSGANGTVDIDRADGDVVASVANCPIRIGALTHGTADLTNAAGGIAVGIPENTVVSVDADSTKGTVLNSVTNPASGTPVTLIARTRLDDIVIHRASR